MKKQLKILMTTLFVMCAALDCSAKDCRKEHERAQRFFRMSQEQAGKNRHARAKFLRKALKTLDKCEVFDNTQKIKILLSLGRLECENEKQKEGAALFDRAADLERMAEFPNSFTFAEIGDIFLELPNPTTEQLNKAATAYEEAIEINSFSSEALKTKARSRLKMLKKH